MIGIIGFPLILKFGNCVGKDSLMVIVAFLSVSINALIFGLISSTTMVFLGNFFNLKFKIFNKLFK